MMGCIRLFSRKVCRLHTSIRGPMRAGGLLLALVFLVGCAGSERSRTDDAPRLESAASSASALAFALRGQGFRVRGASLARPLFADATASAYLVEDGVLQVYQFESPEAARAGADRVALDAVGRTTQGVYQREALVVVFTGRSMAVQNALARTLGFPM